MTLDLPTLSFAVTIVMALSAFILSAHWLVNKHIEGLGGAALGMLLAAIGVPLLVFASLPASELLSFTGQLLVMTGFGAIWLGTAAFWKKGCRSRRRLLYIFIALGASVLAKSILDPNKAGEDLYTIYWLTALFALATVLVTVRALGGLKMVYKGMIRRTAIGAVLVILLFTAHGTYMFGVGVVNFIGQEALLQAYNFSVITRIELILFSISYALIMIIITAEKLQGQLRTQQMIDPLTGALNRSCFLEVMRATVARAKRYSEPVSIIMLDIDRFKRVNLEHGRAVGDQLLRDLTSLIMQKRRAQDVICRFSGEEFILMMPHTKEEGVKMVAERIRHKIAAAAFSTSKGVPVSLTVSVGTVTARGDDLEVDGMLDMVDRRMHHAQQLHFDSVESVGG
ncbi:GGDEF domain-containing protein [Kordiimonas laminariae]|uniref:GGDEF domain-containing protein n=1 Tax=Kordiimonas laminariae TaxID=2917717 RepID=UPI001FF6DA74|nr:GGDEF domain-containing protein [Kordiimonas laminariae]MCK0068682.1 GGDEF domain-containing protein [Kordiimonas laminariae]